jgi:hypothetical protein
MFAVLDLGTGYQILALLHIMSAVVAFGPLFLYPALRKAGQTETIAALHMRMSFPALTLLWVLGMGLAGMSKPDGSDELIYKVSQGWLSGSIVLWAVLMAVSWFLIRPALTDSSESATSKLMAGVGIMHLGLTIGLVLMIWKPGL